MKSEKKKMALFKDKKQEKRTPRLLWLSDNRGFTLLELFVSMLLGILVLAVIYVVHDMQQDTFKRETMKLSSQRNLRSALNLMETEIRMAGYDRMQTNLFGITDIRMDADTNGTITFTFDDGGGSNANNGTLDGDETVTYAIYDSPTTSATGDVDLGRTVGGGATELMAEGIEALGFAYAFDNDENGVLDFNDDDADGEIDAPPGGNEGIYWAVDTDGDNILDTNLDTNKDGRIDAADGTAALPATVGTDRIRAVKICLLSRTRGPDPGYVDDHTYVVGFRRIINPGDSFRRQLMELTVKCRNLGL
jgi:type IV pilus assembly protein PilW